MSRTAPHLANPPAVTGAASTRALTDRQLAMLDRLAEIGMDIAEAAGRAARGDAGGDGAQALDPGLTYSRAARAVRLTIALQQRLTEALAAQEEGRAKARAAEASRLRDRVHRRIERTAEAVAEAEGGDAEAAEHLSAAAWERLTETEDDDLLDLTFDEAVARICRDLGLAPSGFVVEGADLPFALDGRGLATGAVAAARVPPLGGGVGAPIPGPSPIRQREGSRRDPIRRCLTPPEPCLRPARSAPA